MNFVLNGAGQMSTIDLSEHKAISSGCAFPAEIIFAHPAKCGMDWDLHPETFSVLVKTGPIQFGSYPSIFASNYPSPVIQQNTKDPLLGSRVTCLTEINALKKNASIAIGCIHLHRSLVVHVFAWHVNISRSHGQNVWPSGPNTSNYLTWNSLLTGHKADLLNFQERVYEWSKLRRKKNTTSLDPL